MRTKSIYLVLASICGLLSSCDYEHVSAKGEVTTRDLSLSGYNGLKVSNAFDVYLTFSETEEHISIEANDNLHDRIVVAREGDDLIIKLKRFTTIKGKPTLKAYISTKNIKDFNLSGASTVTLGDIWDTNKGKIELSGSSEFSGEINATHLDINMGGASKADIYGNVESLYADLSGASDLRDYDLMSERLNIELSGASEAFLSAQESIDIDASGASVLNYKGDAVINHKKLNGSSRLKNRNQ